MPKQVLMCTEPECKRKLRTKNDFIDHMIKFHNKTITEQDIPPMTEIKKENTNNLFFLCTELNCNKKFKTKEKLILHLLELHKKIVNENDIQEPLIITKDNKKIYEENRNKVKKHEIIELRRKEIEKMNELEIMAKLEAEEKFKQEQLNKYTELQQKKLSIEENLINLMEQLQKREAGSTICGICMDKDADTAPIPCGHRIFCYDCINEYYKKYSNKGCPLCKKEIIMICKIYI